MLVQMVKAFLHLRKLLPGYGKKKKKPTEVMIYRFSDVMGVIIVMILTSTGKKSRVI